MDYGWIHTRSVNYVFILIGSYGKYVGFVRLVGISECSCNYKYVLGIKHGMRERRERWERQERRERRERRERIIIISS